MLYLVQVAHNKREQGFTLFELLVVFLIVGVLAAVAAPNLRGLLARVELNDALKDVRGALLESQREAMRKGQRCSIELRKKDEGANQPAQVVNPTSGDGCLKMTRELDSEINLTSSYSGSVTPPVEGIIEYSFKGNINASDQQTILLSHSYLELKNLETKCLFISFPLGVVRTGIYENNQCQPY